MIFTEKQLKKINKQVVKAVRSGGQVSGRVVEMVLVMDLTLSREYLTEAAKELFSSIRSLGSHYLNMRVNLIKWKGDESLERSVSSFGAVMMGVELDKLDYPKQEEADNTEHEATDDTEQEEADITEQDEADNAEHEEVDNAKQDEIDKIEQKEADVEIKPLSINALVHMIKKNYSKSRFILVLTKDGNTMFSDELLAQDYDAMLKKKTVCVLVGGKVRNSFGEIEPFEDEDMLGDE